MVKVSGRLIRAIKRRVFRDTDTKKAPNDGSLRLNLGCGSDHLEGWVNIDCAQGSKADIVMDFKELGKSYTPNSIKEIMMIHSLSYLRLWEAIDLFSVIYGLLKRGGRLIIESPDVIKCSASLLENKGDLKNYIEAIRGFYAFDLKQIREKEKFCTYAFGWSAWHIKHELEKAGFRSIKISDPETHGRMLWRDTRVEAAK